MAKRMKKVYQTLSLPRVIIPVPLHAKRLKERGFNQALELSKPISRALKIPIDHWSCTRVLPTLPQTNLSRSQRKKNVRHVFKVATTLHAHHVCLVDDVLTTGYTALSLSKALFKAGVQSIDVWCCARADVKTAIQ
jgi:ComF family protein